MSATMALEGAHADEGYANLGGLKDGPVLTMMSKRLRALKKKYNRILQIEENKRQGKTVNKEQEDVVKTKLAVAALIDEYEKLRQPLMVAVKEEVLEREKELLAEREKDLVELEDEVEEPEQVEASVVVEEGDLAEAGNGDVEIGVEAHESGGANGSVTEKEGLVDVVVPPQSQNVSGSEEEKASVEVEKESIVTAEGESQENVFSEGDVGDLLKLLYFAHLFDVRSQGEAPSLVWTRVHERSSCLSYDFVTDDSTTPLIEGDLDALSLFGSMLTSRPPNETLSHRDALQRCIEHAREWLQNSDRVIQLDANTSYSRLRERLTRILSSEYFTMTPELQTVSQQTAAAAASAAGQYLPAKDVDHIVPPAFYVPQEPQLPVSQVYEFGVPVPVTNGIPASSTPLVFLAEAPMPAFEMPQFGSHVSHDEANIGGPEESEEVQATEKQPAEEVVVPVGDGQPQPPAPPHHHPYSQHQQGPPQAGGRSGAGYQQQGSGGPTRGRGGMPGGGYQGMGGRNGGRGYINNGRGGRGGRGGMYPNGGRGGQFYDQHVGFQPRPNHYGGRGGRGGRGGMMYNGQQPNGAAAPPPPTVAAPTQG